MWRGRKRKEERRGDFVNFFFFFSDPQVKTSLGDSKDKDAAALFVYVYLYTVYFFFCFFLDTSDALVLAVHRYYYEIN